MNHPSYPDPERGDWRDTAVKIGFESRYREVPKERFDSAAGHVALHGDNRGEAWQGRKAT